MMPRCEFKRCKRVAEVELMKLDCGDKDGYGKPWPKTVYTCRKCAKKICKMLNYQYKEGV